jgi:iron complex transport system substrate-binding protein
MLARLTIGCLAVFLASPAKAQDARPTLVSLDYCADQFVLGLADRDQILAVSKDAEKPFSHLRDKAVGIRKVRAVTEDIVALKPDMVVRSWGGDVRSLALFERLGIETVQVGYAAKIEDAAKVTREVATAFGQAERGLRFVDAMPGPSAPTGRSALYLTPGGVTAGQGTMVDSLLTSAGLNNAVSAQGWSSLPMETLVLDPPSLAVTAFFGFDTDVADHWSPSRHPVLARILRGVEAHALNESRLTCPAWFVADEAAALSKVVR